MKIIIDTHAFLWLAETPEKLSETGRQLIYDRKNTLWLSLASVWEMQIKLDLGKLTMRDRLSRTIDEQINTNKIRLLPVRFDHILALEQLPKPHNDPFDRMLVAQALVESSTLLTQDKMLLQYPIPVIW